MTDLTLWTVGLDLPALASSYMGWSDPELLLEPGENAILVAGAKLLISYVGNPAAIDDPVLAQGLRPSLALLERLAPDRFLPGLAWPRPLFLLAGEGARWFTDETHGVRATPTALLRARDALGKLQAVLADAATSRRLPDFAISLARVNRAMAEVAPVVSFTITIEAPAAVDWKQQP